MALGEIYLKILLILLIILNACQFSSEQAGDTVVIDHKEVGYRFTVVAPDSGFYYDGENIDITLTYPKAVTVTGLPRLTLELDSGDKYATYFSGSGTDTLVFRYPVVFADEDLDGIDLASTIDLNNGTLKYETTKDCDLTLRTPYDVSGIKINNSAPFVIDVTPHANGTYYEDETLDFNLQFSDQVDVTGIPRISLNVGGSTVYADYSGGTGTDTLTFTYTVGGSDSDIDGLAMVSPIDLNSGSIDGVNGAQLPATLTYTAPDTSGVIIRGDVPLVLSVTLPADATYINNQSLDLVLTISKDVNVTGTPSITTNVGGTTRTFDYLSGSGTDTLTFRYDVVLGDLDLNGIGIATSVSYGGGESIQSTALGVDLLNDLSFGDTSNILVDALGPQIINIIEPSDATYIEGQDIDFTVVYNEAVDVTGFPQIQITLDSGTVNAQYQSGTGTSNLVFRYTAQAGDEDQDGVVYSSSINLNTGTMIGSDSNDADLDFSDIVYDTSNVFIDAVAPYIVSITPPADATYYENEILDFTVTFNEPVTIFGGPRIPIDVGGSTVYANYQSGSGTSTPIFRYSVGGSDKDLDGLTLTSPMELNSGTIRDAVTQNAVLTFTPPATPGLIIRGDVPYVTSIDLPADDTYIESENIDIVVNTSKVVNVTGTPYIEVDVGGSTEQFIYQSGTGSSALTFRYVVVLGDFDNDGIEIQELMNYDGGESIQSGAGVDLKIDFTAPASPGILVDAVGPQIISVTPPADATYAIGENLDIQVNYDEVVNMTGAGTPSLALTLDTGAVIAEYLSGDGTSTLTFRYTVQANDNDSDGVVYGTLIDLDGNTLKGNDLNDADLDFSDLAALDTTGVLIDGIAPYITSVTPPANNTYIIGDNIDFVVNFNENVDYSAAVELTVTIGASGEVATYISGSGSNALTFRYTVQPGDEDTDGVTLSSPLSVTTGSINDQVGNEADYTFTLPDTSGVLVDGIVPYIDSVTSPTHQVYALNDNIDITVNWSEAVTKTGTPRIEIDIGGVTKYATYFSGDGTDTWTMRYTVEASLLDEDGITLVSPLQLNSGTITDLPGNTASPLTYSLPDTSGVFVDTTGPVILSITPPADTTYVENTNVDFIINWDENVIVTGSPSFNVDVGGVTKTATYFSGSGTMTHTYRYTVSALSSSGDEDLNGISFSSPVSLNSGTIQDAYANDATLTFTPTPTSLANVYVDAKNPNITSVTPPSDGLYDSSATYRNIDFSVQFHEPVTVSGSPRIHLTIDGTTRYASYNSGTGSDTLVFRYQVATKEIDMDGIQVANSNNIDFNSGSIRDASSHDSLLDIGSHDLSNLIISYRGMKLWLDLDDASTVTGGCGGNATAISDKSNSGNDLTSSGTAPVYNCTGFGTESTAYLQFNENGYYVIPNLTNIQYFFVVTRSQTDEEATGAYLGDTFAEFYYYTFFFTQERRLRFSNNTAYKMNGSALSGNNTQFTGDLWDASTNYVMGLRWQNAAAFNSGRVGNDNFDGQIAEVIIFDNTEGTLSDADMTKVTDYLNAKHGVH